MGVFVGGEIDTKIIFSLMGADIGLGGIILLERIVNVEMVWLEAEDDGDGRRFFKIPELEAREFIDDDVVFGDFWQGVEGGHADVAYEKGFFAGAQIV